MFVPWERQTVRRFVISIMTLSDQIVSITAKHFVILFIFGASIGLTSLDCPNNANASTLAEMLFETSRGSKSKTFYF
jgi:hypothetical protein